MPLGQLMGRQNIDDSLIVDHYRMLIQHLIFRTDRYDPVRNQVRAGLPGIVTP